MKLIAVMVGLTTLSCFATPITMPSAEVLKQRLNDAGFTHFIEKTSIVKDLAGQQKEVLGVATSVDLALYDYSENLKNPMMARMMEMRKPQLLQALLQDHPAALKELADRGLYKQ